jgi:peptidoglycan pentaglycine glycine transferase (the first glycine)
MLSITGGSSEEISMTEMDARTWNSIIASLPNPHILQSWEWGQVKARFGWQPIPKVWQDENGQAVAAALVLQRMIPVRGFAARLRILYVPRGPVLDWCNAALRSRVLDDLHTLAKRQNAIFIKIDPDVPLGTGIPSKPGSAEDNLGLSLVDELQARGWRFSEEQIQFRNTVVVDLSADEDQLLSNMKQKTRYNVRLAGRKGVTIRKGTQDDLGVLYQMYAETSIRDGFVIRDEGYYRAVWSTFMDSGEYQSGSSSEGADPNLAPWKSDSPVADPIIAEVDGQVVAAVFIFHFAGRAWYLYGMSREQHREKMPNYLLQWEAMRRARAAGCAHYDLWGAPDVFDESDSMWGVYRFKEGLGGQVERYIGAWDLPVNKFLYSLYSQVLPRLLNLMRRRGKANTRQALAG